jgi:Tfp pilus assembly protein PilF
MITHKTSVLLAALCAVALLATGCSGAAERKAGYLRKGEAYFAAQNYDKARVELRNALQIDPKYVAARYLAGRVAAKTGDLREAVGHYQAAIDAEPRFAPARAALARLYLLGGMTDKTSELIDAGLLLAPDDAALLVVRAGVKAQSGDLPAALVDAEAAYRKEPGDEYAVSLLASLYKKQGQLEQAVTVVSSGLKAQPRSADLHVVMADLEAARQRYDLVQQHLQQLIVLEPEVLAHRGRLAQFHLFRKEVPAAEQVWRQTIKDLPGQQEPRLALVELLWAQHDEAAARAEIQSQLAGAASDQSLQLEFASLLMRHGKLDDAEQAFLDVIKRAGKTAPGLGARNRLAALYLSQSTNAAATPAAKLIDEVLAESPRDNDALILRANMALQKGDATTAITDLRTVLRDQPNSIPLQRALARAHLQNQDATLAEETLRNALQINPGDADVRKELALLLLQQGKAEPAKTLLEQLAAAAGPQTDPELLDAQFRSQLLTRDVAGALETARKVQQLQPKTATGWYLQGLAEEVQQNPGAARKSYQAALVRQPDVAEPLAALVRLDLAERQSARAFQRVDQAIAGHPGHFGAYNMRGELQLAARNWPAAIAAFTRSAELAPKWWAPYRGLAIAQQGAGQSAQAVLVYQRGIAATGSGELSLDLAALQERLGHPEEAMQVYRQWLQRQPGSLEAANNLAMLLVSQRSDKASLDEAAKWAEQLRNSSAPELLDTRGWVKFKSGDYQNALSLLRQAATGLPQASAVRYHLGMAQWKAGDIAGARDSLQAALRSNEQFAGIEEARRTLSALGNSG